MPDGFKYYFEEGQQPEGAVEYHAPKVEKPKKALKPQNKSRKAGTK